MNCQTFETVVSELARDQMLEASAREQAILHTRQCEECSSRLNEQLNLTAQLRQLSADMRIVQMPQGAEETLLAEFRNINTRRFDSARFRWAYAYASAAAVLLIALVVVATRFSRPTPSTRIPNEVAVVQPQTGPVEAQKPAPRETQKVPPSTGTKPAVRRKAKPVRSRDVKPLEAIAQTIPQAEGVSDTEIATQFIPVGYSNPAMLQDGGQVVRVELPRYGCV
jgi:cell division septation protein DedD